MIAARTETTGWQRLYDDGGFAITTAEPSSLVAQYAHLIPAGTPVADLGCGELRNSSYIAALGHPVHACDVAALGQRDKHPGVEYGHHGVEDFGFQRGLYGGILMIRLIHYLPLETLADLIQRAAEGLATNGLLLVSYNVGGGIHDMPDLAVPKFIHPIPVLMQLVRETGLKVMTQRDFVTTQQHTNLDGTLHACELIAIKS